MVRAEWLHARAASRITGLSSEQLRECIDLGLIESIQTVSGKHRYHIGDLQSLADRYRGHHATVQAFEDRLQAETQPLFDQIAELQKRRSELERKIYMRKLSR